MNVSIYHLLEGALQAKGITVIIDVFRAFSVETYFFAQGAECIYPLADEKEARRMKERDTSLILCGERNAIKLPGFDYGNSPSEIQGSDFTGKQIVHTTSAGTQGFYAATNATELLTGSFPNAKAIAAYIRAQNPDDVSLVAMGWNAKEIAEEDELCALYIKSLLEENPIADIQEKADALRYNAGKKFFDPDNTIFPQADFGYCVSCDKFPFVIRVEKEGDKLVGRKIEVPCEA